VKTPGPPAASVGRILVVEDSPSARRLMQDVLVRLGAELPSLRVAGTVGEALHQFTDWRPEVVFVDIELDRGDATTTISTDAPRILDRDPKDGVELAEFMLRRDPRVHVILCSATDPSDPRIARLMANGQVHFILKPLRAARVEEMLALVGPPPVPRRP
jgi:CheY-like chemotaxis protein